MKQAAVIPAVWEQCFELGACGTEIVRKGDDKTKRKYAYLRIATQPVEVSCTRGEEVIYKTWCEMGATS